MPKRGKDPNKPKGCKSAYIYFTEHRREELTRNEQKFEFGTFASECGNLWKTMSDEEKACFEKLAHKDKLRYQKEMESYSPPEYSDDSDDDGGRRKKKKKKDPHAPKRNISAYFFFAERIREEVKEKLGEEKGEAPKVTEVMKEIGSRWSCFPEDQKAEFEEKARKDKERYQRQLTEYTKTGQFTPV